MIKAFDDPDMVGENCDSSYLRPDSWPAKPANSPVINVVAPGELAQKLGTPAIAPDETDLARGLPYVGFGLSYKTMRRSSLVAPRRAYRPSLLALCVACLAAGLVVTLSALLMDRRPREAAFPVAVDNAVRPGYPIGCARWPTGEWYACKNDDKN